MKKELSKEAKEWMENFLSIASEAIECLDELIDDVVIEGKKAFESGLSEDDNPYKENLKKAELWNSGYFGLNLSSKSLKEEL